MREALANAVCHRDYGLANDIQVKILEDRIVIANPDQLPFDLTLADLDDPELVSRPRNRLIAQAFYDMHIIEHYGSGMRRMRKDCDENGSPYPTMKSGNGEFRITFSDRTRESIAKLGIPPEKFGIVADVAEVAKNPEEVAKKVAKRVSAAELRIIECIVEAPSISQAAIAERLGMTRQYIGRCMDDLQKRQIIRRVGPKKGGHWEMIFTESLNEKNNV